MKDEENDVMNREELRKRKIPNADAMKKRTKTRKNENLFIVYGICFFLTSSLTPVFVSAWIWISL